MAPPSGGCPPWSGPTSSDMSDLQHCSSHVRCRDSGGSEDWSVSTGHFENPSWGTPAFPRSKDSPREMKKSHLNGVASEWGAARSCSRGPGFWTYFLTALRAPLPPSRGLGFQLPRGALMSTFYHAPSISAPPRVLAPRAPVRGLEAGPTPRRCPIQPARLWESPGGQSPSAPGWLQWRKESTPQSGRALRWGPQTLHPAGPTCCPTQTRKLS